MAQKLKKKTITQEIKDEVDKIVQKFNETELKDRPVCYTTRYRQNYLYLDREDDGMHMRVCRLKYTGKLDDWEFAIYRYSKEKYDSDEWIIPGMGFVDGTVEGAMRAGLEAYQPQKRLNPFSLLRLFR